MVIIRALSESNRLSDKENNKTVMRRKKNEEILRFGKAVYSSGVTCYKERIKKKSVEMVNVNRKTFFPRMNGHE